MKKDCKLTWGLLSSIGCVAVIFGYFGTFMHKGRMLSFGAFIMGIGSLTMALPHFIDGNYQIGVRESELCVISNVILNIYTLMTSMWLKWNNNELWRVHKSIPLYSFLHTKIFSVLHELLQNFVLHIGNSTECDEDGGGGSQGQQNYLWLFILGQVFHAVGGSSLYTLSVPLLDENVRRKDSAFYIGMLSTVFAPVILGAVQFHCNCN